VFPRERSSGSGPVVSGASGNRSGPRGLRREVLVAGGRADGLRAVCAGQRLFRPRGAAVDDQSARARSRGDGRAAARGADRGGGGSGGLPEWTLRALARSGRESHRALGAEVTVLFASASARLVLQMRTPHESVGAAQDRK